MMDGMRMRTMVWGAALGAAGAALGHSALRTEQGRELDEQLFKAVNDGHGPEADRFFFSVTELGSLYAAGAAAAAIAVCGRPREAARALSAAGATWMLGQGIKKAVDRPRPFQADEDGTRRMIAEPHGTSWPSSHPAVLTTFTRVAARELGLGSLASAALTALDGVVATSRVYLGVHYPSDVGSGLLFGRAVARVWPRGRSRR